MAFLVTIISKVDEASFLMGTKDINMICTGSWALALALGQAESKARENSHHIIDGPWCGEAFLL